MPGFNQKNLRFILTAFCFIIASVAAKAETLTVYTYNSFISEWGPGPQIKKLFEKECQCELKFIAAEDGVSILNRLKIEGSGTKADVALGLDNGLLTEASESGLFQKHQTDTSSVIESLAWKEPFFVPYDFGYFAFIYDSDKVKQPVGSFEQLLASNARIIYQDPRTSTPGQGLMMWVKAVYGEQAATAWQKISKNTVTVTKGWWEAYSMFLEGASDYVLSYTTSPAYHMIAEQKKNFKAAQFKEGHVRQIEIAGITQHARNPDLANRFLTFLLSPEAQNIIPVTNWMLPVVKGVKLPEAFDQLISPQAIGFTPEAIARNRKQWIKEWRTSVTN